MRRLHPLDHVALGAVGCSALLSAWLYARLPARVPIHFDVHGQPDDWASRPVGAFLMPALMLVLWALLRSGRGAARGLGTEAARRLVRLALVAFLATLHVAVLRTALGADFPLTAVTALAACLWVVLGLLLPRLRRNLVVGLRTPATLASDEAWQRANRLGGHAMVLGGLVALALAQPAPMLAMAALAASSLLPLFQAQRSSHRAP